MNAHRRHIPAQLNAGPNPALYALVSVQWATEVATVDTDTDAATAADTTELASGLFGTARGQPVLDPRGV
ncbi:hypothetical protein [Williamsia sp.]|uniref:hypothetical protein n=1 Tax=Williamsia sp. TaxID=1872085 RepID=UPI002F93A295